MKKIIFLLLSLLSFSVYSQEPTHVKMPKTFQPGNWYMIGQWDSVSGSYKDTLGYYLEGDTTNLWSNKPLRYNAPKHKFDNTIYSNGLSNSGNLISTNGIFQAGLTNSKGWQFGLSVDTANLRDGRQISNFAVSKGTPHATDLKISGTSIVSNTDGSHRAVMQSSKYNSSFDIMYQNTIEAKSDGISLYYTDSTGANNELEVVPQGLILKTNSKERLLIDTNGRINIHNSYYLPLNKGTNGQTLILNGDSLIFGNGGGGGGLCFNKVTKTQADSLIGSKALTEGCFYEISGCDKNLYDDGTHSGTTIILQAVSTNAFASNGTGIFYNPKYSKTINGFGIWKSDSVYNVNSHVIWGGYWWINLTGVTDSSIDVLNLDTTNWGKILYNDKLYNIAYDAITYDYQNNFIVSRYEAASDNYVSESYFAYKFLSGSHKLIKRSIAVFQWGNGFSLPKASGIGNNKVDESYAEFVNFTGKYAINNTISHLSMFVDVKFINNSVMAYNTIDNYSVFGLCTFINSSYVMYNKLDLSEIYDVHLSDNSSLKKNTLSSAALIQHDSISGSSDIAGNILNDSVSIEYNILEDNSHIDHNILKSDSRIRKCELYNSSYISDNNLIQTSSIDSIFIDSSYISNNTLSVQSYIKNDSLINVSYYSNNTLSDLSKFENNVVKNYSYITDNNLTQGSSISNTQAGDTSFVKGNTLAGASGFDDNYLFKNSGIMINSLDITSGIANNNITDGSFVGYNKMLENSNIYKNILSDTAGIVVCSLSLGSSISKDTLSAASIGYCALNNNSKIRNNNLIAADSVPYNIMNINMERAALTMNKTLPSTSWLITFIGWELTKRMAVGFGGANILYANDGFGELQTVIDPAALHKHHGNAVRSDVLEDGETFFYPHSSYGFNGFGSITATDTSGIMQEAVYFFTFNSDGTVNLVNNTTNVATSDTPGKLCVYFYFDGTDIVVKNNLGIKIVLNQNITYSYSMQ